MSTPLYKLVDTFNQSVPRYTSYPTVPHWKNTPSEEDWMLHINDEVNKNEGISIYIHLPFCEHLCSYCGCNTSITKNHNVEPEYIEAIKGEWDKYVAQFDIRPTAKEIHLGGGTPTFFQPEHLESMMNYIMKDVIIDVDTDISIELHPRHTTLAHLKTLKRIGFNRLSVGIQDFNSTVLRTINRDQNITDVTQLLQRIKALDFEDINFDLIYGLPHQTVDSFLSTIKKVILFSPDRIAMYSYAHVPWKKKSQSLFLADLMPTGVDKIKLFEAAKALLEAHGYYQIGFDHFAKATDELYLSYQNETLHRNFMGFTPHKTNILIGLGASSISSTNSRFVQNHKNFRQYEKLIKTGTSTIINGHVSIPYEQHIGQHIQSLMCQFETTFTDDRLDQILLQESAHKIKELMPYGVIQWDGKTLRVTELGKYFLRNICSTLDYKFTHSNLPQFSAAI